MKDKSLKKKLLKHPAAQALLAWILAGFIRLVYYSSKKTRHVHPEAQSYISGEKNAIFAFWHGRMMVMPCFEPPGRTMRVLISGHRDGKLISRVIGHFGESTITGSSSKGGRVAAAALIAALKAGDNICITPDGPRGPYQEAAKGIIRLAALTGYPIIPVTFHSTRHKRLKSWDRFMLALPFGHIRFVADAPLSIHILGEEQDVERLRIRLQDTMRRQTEYMDAA